MMYNIFLLKLMHLALHSIYSR